MPTISERGKGVSVAVFEGGERCPWWEGAGGDGRISRRGERPTVADAERILWLSPPTSDGVDVTGTDTAGYDLDVHIVILKSPRRELVLVELGPCLCVVDLEPGEGVWVNHRCVFRTQKQQPSSEDGHLRYDED